MNTTRLSRKLADREPSQLAAGGSQDTCGNLRACPPIRAAATGDRSRSITTATRRLPTTVLLFLCAVLPLSAAEKASGSPLRPEMLTLWIGAGLLGILVAVVVWNRSLALKVRAHTAALRDELARRIEADKALEASEEMFSRAFRSSPDAVFLTRLSDGRVIDTNDSAARIFKCSKEELIGHRTVGEGWGYAGAEDRDRLVSLIRGQGGKLRDHEMQMLRMNGERFTALVSCETIEVSGEKCFVGVLRDVTDQRRAQEALQRSESALGALMDALPTPAMLLEKDGRFAAANEALALSLRCRRQELIGQIAYAMLPPDVASSRQAAIDQVFASGQGIRFEDSNGGRHYINYLSPVLGAAGAVTRVAVFALDITEHMRAEQEVRESEERFSKAFHASPAIIAISTFPEGRYVDVNAQFTETLGYTRAEVLGRRALDLGIWAQPEQRQAVFDRLAQGDIVRDAECLLRTKAGELRHVLVSVERISLGTQPCLLFSNRDITDRKQAEAIQEAMVSLTTRLSGASTPTEAARVIYETADRFWRWDAGALDLYSPTEERVWAVMYLDLIEGQRREVPQSNSSERLTPRMRRVMEGGPELVLRRPSEMQVSDSVAFGDKARLSASIMSVPIRSHGQFAGVLSIQSYAPNAFTDTDLKLLQGLADYCGDTLERIRTTQALRQSREQFQQLFQSSPLATAIYSNRDGRIVNVNTRLLELFQYRMKEVIGRTVLELGIWCDHSARDQMLARLQRNEEVRDFEARLRGQDGQEHDLLLSAQVIELPDGPMVIVQANDITERKRAEQALRASEARLHAIVHHTPNVAVQGYNLEGRVRLWNDASTRMFGFDAETAMGKTLDQLIHTREEAEKFVEVLRGLAGTGKSVGPAEYRFHRRNGEQGWCLSTIFEIPGMGSESLFVCMDVDIAARKQAEAALQESEERLRLALDAAHMGIFDWDMTSQRIVWSHWHEELWGFKPGEFPGTYEAFSQRVHPDDLPGINAEVTRCMAAHEPFVREFRVVWPDGGVRWILGTGQFEFAADGQPRRMRGTVIEITDRKRAETERQQLLVQLLEAEDEERGRLARELHDTTAQHLAATKMNLTRLSDDATVLPPPVPQLLSDSLGLVSQALNEIRTLTYLLHPPLLEELGLAGAVRDYAAGFARRSGLRASVDTEGFTGRLPPAMELALFRVAQESLGNVHRHSGSEYARIRLERDAEEVRLEIQDNGRGMPDDARAGVGLAGMRERLRQLGGRLEIESDAEGTTVLASLPLDEVKEKGGATLP